MINECVQGGIADTLTVSDRSVIGERGISRPNTAALYLYPMGYEDEDAKK